MKKIRLSEKSRRIYEEMVVCYRNNQYTIKINQIVGNEIRKKNKTKFIDVLNITNQIKIKSSFFSDSYKVHNVYRYSIKISDGIGELYCFQEGYNHYNNSIYNDYDILHESELPSIVILLESPHSEEYSLEYTVKGPAQGKTGEYIESEIKSIINNIIKSREINIDDGEYRIILVNPIPFQTSLHYLHNGSLTRSYYKMLRDRVWLELWEKEGVFQLELQELLNKLNPIIVLNSCTSNLKDPINKFLIKNGISSNVYTTRHPSGWWDEINLEKLKVD
ncbi:hypothetical protein ACQKMV_07905 [Lysinibacillus sp. NPDC094403]|uniref:hypothetical protein n=1 Tax=Lysinibacillus sp. NPDC094403 TaxID=3390581 RepID=UPI003CFD4AD4